MGGSKKGAILWSIALLAVGAVILLCEFGVIAWAQTARYLPAAALFVIGIGLHVRFFVRGRNKSSMLVPAGACLVYGVYFLLKALDLAEGWWPLLLLGVAVGSMESHLLNKQHPRFKTQDLLLIALCAVLVLNEKTAFSLWMLVGIALLCCGAAVLIRALHQGDAPIRVKWHVHVQRDRDELEEDDTNL